MSWNERCGTGAALVAWLLCGRAAVQAQTPAAPPAFTCPAIMTVRESSDAKAPWQAEPGKSEHKFSRPSIYNGTPGKAEYDLAPEEQTKGQQVHQKWNLADYRSMNLFVRCRYEDTEVTLVTDLPKALTVCSFAFRNVAGKPPQSPSFECH
jgi:hypothetical protein